MTLDYTLGRARDRRRSSSTSPTLCFGPSGSEKATAMTLNGWIQILVFCAIVVALVKPLGWYMTRVFNGERTFLSPVLRPVEIGLYRLRGRRASGASSTGLTYTRRHAALQPAGLPRPLLPSALPGRAALQSRGHGARSRRTSPSTPPPAS